MSRLRRGQEVRVADNAKAELQRGLTGMVVAISSTRSMQAHHILVDLRPDDDGLYGGPYWFPVSDLAPTPAGRDADPADA